MPGPHPTPLTKLYVEPTTRCNLDCVMCVRGVWHEPLGSMSLALYRTLLEQVGDFTPRPTIHLSGYGEPTSHPAFLEMVRLAKQAGCRVEMTTNGALLDRTLCQALVDLDMDRIVVSIDGADPERYADIRVRGSFQQVIENLLWLKRLRVRRSGRHGNPQLALAFVAMRSNIDHLARLPRLASKLGAWEILVSNVVPHSAAMEQEILYRGALTGCAYRASRWVPSLSLPKIDLDGGTLEPLGGAFASTASISLLGAPLSARNDICQFAHAGYAAVRWDGAVSPCLSLLHDHPEYVRGRRREITHLSFGNIADVRLRDLWDGPAFSAFRDRLQRFPFSPCSTCGGCERFPRNQEDCTGNGFPTCGGCLWAQGFIQCA